MSMPLAVAAAAVFSLGGNADTTVAVRHGTTLHVANFAGEIVVKAWERNAVRIEADVPDRERILVKAHDGVLMVKAYSQKAAHRSVDLRITAPPWMDLNVSGIHTDVTIDGTRGRVRVETVHGDIAVAGGRGQIQLHAVNQDIHLIDASGVVLSETVNGDLTLQRIESDSVDVSTVNGEIFYEGTIRDRGVYRFTSHNGDIAVALPKTASATVNVATFSGEFDSDFPVTLSESKPGRRFCFTMGRGSARVELESFQGTIHIFRPGSRGEIAEVEKEARARLKAQEERQQEKSQKKGKRQYGGEDDDSEQSHDDSEDVSDPDPDPNPDPDHNSDPDPTDDEQE